MNRYDVVRAAFAITATLVVLAWLVATFAVGFGWQVPEGWSVGTLGTASFGVVAICVIGIPVSALVEMGP